MTAVPPPAGSPCPPIRGAARAARPAVGRARPRPPLEKLACFLMMAIAVTMFYPSARLTPGGIWLMPLSATAAGVPYLLEVLALALTGIWMVGVVGGVFSRPSSATSASAGLLLLIAVFVGVETFFFAPALADPAGRSQARTFLIGLGFFIAASNIRWRLDDIRRFLAIFWAIMLFHAVFVFMIPRAAWFRPIPGLPVQIMSASYAGTQRVAGYWFSFSLLATMLGMAWVSALSVLMHRQMVRRGRMVRFGLIAVVSVVFLTGIMMTGSRAPVFAVAAAVAFALVSGRELDSVLTRSVPVIGIGLIVASVTIGMAEPLQQRFERTSEGDSAPDHRWEILADAARVALYSPLGTGFGGFEATYVDLFHRESISSGHMQNSFVGVLIALGWGGFAALMVLIIQILHATRRTAARAVDPSVRGYALAIRYGLIVWLIVGLFEEFFWEPSAALMFWALAAFAVALQRSIGMQVSDVRP